MNAPVLLHIRFEGRSFDVPLGDLDVGTGSTDEQVKQALAGYLQIDRGKFQHYVVDRHSTGNLTMRPQAVFG